MPVNGLADVSRILNFLAKPAVVFTLVLLCILYTVFVFDFGVVPKLRDAAHAGLLDDTLAYNVADVEKRFAAYGAAGRAAYRSFTLSFDLVYAFLYALALAALISLLGKALRISERVLALLAAVPLLAALVDYLEDAGLVALLDQYPRLSPSLVALTSTMTIAKLSLIMLSILMIGSALMLLALRKAVGEPRHSTG